MLSLMILGLLAVVDVASAQDDTPQKIEKLAGYSPERLLSGFEAHLLKDRQLYETLIKNPEVSEKILRSTSLQRQVLNGIRRGNMAQTILHEHLGAESAPGVSSYPVQNIEKPARRESHGHPPQEAKQEIRKAEELLSRNKAFLNDDSDDVRENLERALITTEQINQALNKNPQVRDAFFENPELLGRIMNDEITINEAFSSLGAGESLPVIEPEPAQTPEDVCKQQGRVPPPGMTQATNIVYKNDTHTTNWTETWGLKWPRGNQRNVVVQPNTYIALKFNTGDMPNETRSSTFFSHPMFGPWFAGGDKIVTMSECPGDFGPQDDPGCRVTMGGGGFTAKIGPHKYFCSLKKNTTYYFNILYTDENAADLPDASPTRWYCTGNDVSPTTSPCGNVITP